MATLRNRLGVAGILFLAAATGWAAEQPDKASDKDAKDKATTSTTDPLKNLPPGAIIVVCPDLKSAKELRPDLILLTPKQYQDLRNEAAQAKTKGPPEETRPG